MNIVVLIKHVPDASGSRAFNADLTSDRDAVEGRLSELDEYAVEQALQVAAQVGGEITFVTMGPPDAAQALRKALAMGGDHAVHVQDDSLHGSDALTTSLVLATALRKLEWDLVMCGMGSTDALMSVIPSMISERLGVPGLSLASLVSVENDQVTIRRDGEEATMTVSASLPAMVSVTDQTGEARYPTFKGIMAAKKKSILTWSLADLGMDPSTVGLDAAWSKVEQIKARPPRGAGVIVPDKGNAAADLADFLATNQLV